MICSSWDIEQNILKLAILDFLCPFISLKIPKIKILKNEKICWRYYHFTHVYQKSQSYDVWFLGYVVTDRIFCHFGPFFALLPPTPQPPLKLFPSTLIIPKIRILKKMKKMPTDISLLYMHMYNK